MHIKKEGIRGRPLEGTCQVGRHMFLEELGMDCKKAKTLLFKDFNLDLRRFGDYANVNLFGAYRKVE